MHPIARNAGLLVTAADLDLMVYDSESHHLHTLNATSAAIWNACDGHRSVQDIARAVSVEFDRVVTVEVVEHTLGSLADVDLLVDGTYVPTATPRRGSRRALLRNTGIAAAVVSISAPSAIAAQSETCIPLRGECTPGEPNLCCAPGLCDLWAGTSFTLCCLPNGMETPDTAVCCSGRSSLEEIGSDVRICIP